MFKFLLLSFFLLLHNVGLAATDAITLNGILGEKAVVMIKGKLEVYSKGQRKHGVQLISVMEDSAVFDIKGKSTTLYMAKAFGSNSPIAKEMAQMDEAKSHFIAAKLVFQTWNTMTYEVDYFYDGSQGSLVTLSAKPYFLGSTGDNWRYPYIKILEGRHTVQLTISTNDNVTGQYLSDEVVFQMLWANENKSGVLAEHRHKQIKEWTQAAPET